jgi:diguanylate cyclase (GGDEF)-like protein
MISFPADGGNEPQGRSVRSGLDPDWAGRSFEAARRWAATLPGLGVVFRARMLSEADAGRLRAAQVATILRYSPLMIAANAFNAVVLVAALSLRPPSPTPYIWASLLTLYLMRLVMRRRGRRTPAARTTASPAFVRKAVANAGVLGLMWSMVPILFFDAGRSDQLIVTCVCVGMLCGGSFALATLPAAVMLYTLPISLGCLIALVRNAHDPIHFLAVPMLLCYCAALSGAAIAHGLQFADRVVAQLRAETAAQHDALTGLPNRPAFEAALNKAFERLARYGERFALLYFDLDHFKRVNDRLGHDAGDQLLRQVAGRLAGAVGERETVARLGGDEFVLLARGSRDALSAAQRADQMAQCFDAPFTLDGTAVDCRPSIGVALAPSDGPDPASLLRVADAALYKAKRSRNKGAHFYRAAEDRAAGDRRELAHDLQGALGRGEFSLHYQPILALDGNHVLSCEALLRWRHPRGDFISPAQFVPIAETSGAIHEIGEWAMREACAEATTWPDHIDLSVNISAEQICDRSILGVVESALRESGLPPQRLRIEITESARLAQSHGTADALEQLSDRGVAIVLDDFGTGYSSFDHIRRLSVRCLKIDRSFVSAVPFDRKCVAVVHAITHLARTLDIEVTAEGIETEAQLEFLRLARCHSGQGHLFARPQSADALRRSLQVVEPRARYVA